MKRDSKVVFFDMGNTLLHFHVGKTDEEKDNVGVNNLTIFLKQFNEEIKIENVKKKFLDTWQQGISSRKRYHTEYPVEEYLNGFLKEYGVELGLNMCIKAIDVFYSEYRNNIWVEPDIHQTLGKIRQKGYRIGIISNSSRYDEVMINCFKKAGIAKYIDLYTFSYYLRISKPRIEIFQIALDRMNVDAKNAIMVGDNLISDIEPAQKLGLTGIWFNKDNISNNSDIEPDNEIIKLNELVDLL